MRQEVSTEVAISSDDPEASPGGRESYLGRTIARTMHWRGAPWLLRETRENEENGARLREWLAVSPGAAVCDLGCGNGYHTLPLAEAVGAKGRVFAVDLQPEMLRLLADRATELGIDNLVPLEATVDDPKLPKASCDVVLMVDVYHELSHPVRVLGHVRRALKPAGVCVLVEFRAEDRSVPIKPLHKMTKAQVIREMAANGFRLAAETEALPWQHAMAFGRVEDPGEQLEPLELARGFVRAAGGNDARILEPFFAPQVTFGSPGVAAIPARELAMRFAEPMRSGSPPLPPLATVEVRPGQDGAFIARITSSREGEPDEAAPTPLGELLLRRDERAGWQIDAWYRTSAANR